MRRIFFKYALPRGGFRMVVYACFLSGVTLHYIIMRTLFVENPPSPGGEVSLDRREAEHLFRVLRAVPGERFRLLNGRGGVFGAEVLPDRKLRVESAETFPEPALKIHLFFAQPRRNRLDALLPGCVETGVWKLHPVLCARSVAEGTPNDRWRLQLIEGCKQSGNPFLPEIVPPEPLLPALRRAAASGMTLFYGRVRGATASVAFPESGEIGWVVGPEGGFTPEEERALAELEVRPLNLGPWVMRLETAALCGVAVLRRLLTPLLLLGALFFFSGCGEADAARHPLVRKGDYYRDSGDAKLAAEFYRRAVGKYPRSVALHLRMAALCDESLDDPLGAAWHYTEYLRLAPESADRALVESCRKSALERLAAAGTAADLAALEEENRRLREGLNETRRRMLAMQRRAEARTSRYTVRVGDTPALVARRNNVSLEALLRANGLTRSSRLRVGQELVVPIP